MTVNNRLTLVYMAVAELHASPLQVQLHIVTDTPPVLCLEYADPPLPQPLVTVNHKQR